LDAASVRVGREVAKLIADSGAGLVVSPHQEDRHHGHVAVARGVRAGIEAAAGPDSEIVWWQWGLWADLRRPTIFSGFGDFVMELLVKAMAAHRGEALRNRYVELLPARARRSAILGAELVFGFGATGLGSQYAELLAEARYSDGAWATGPARVLDARQPLT
jgi:hypothetical protein